MRKSNLKAAEICILQIKMTLIVTFIQSSSSHPQLVAADGRYCDLVLYKQKWIELNWD